MDCQVSRRTRLWACSYSIWKPWYSLIGRLPGTSLGFVIMQTWSASSTCYFRWQNDLEFLLDTCNINFMLWLISFTNYKKNESFLHLKRPKMSCRSGSDLTRVSSGQGKVREIPDLAKVREKSGNFVEGQGKGWILGKVREKSGNLHLVQSR